MVQHLPDDLLAHAFPADLIAPVDRPEQMLVRAFQIRSTMHQQLSALLDVFVNPAGRGSRENQAMNSSSPRLYTRRAIGEDTLSSISAFSLRQSEALSATTSSFMS